MENERYVRVSIYSPDVAWKEKAILDTQENLVAPFGVENGDTLEDVLEYITVNGPNVYRWLDAGKVRIDDQARS